MGVGARLRVMSEVVDCNRDRAGLSVMSEVTRSGPPQSNVGGGGLSTGLGPASA